VREQPELVGKEGVVPEPVSEAAVLEILDPELGSIPSLDIPVIELRRLIL